jgi:YggT family protein
LFVTTVWSSIGLVLWIYYILVISRLVVEITRQFARAWRPAGVAAIGVEMVYASTDPPLRAIRKVCPPVRIGTVSLDLSVMILLLAILALRTVTSYLGTSA